MLNDLSMAVVAGICDNSPEGTGFERLLNKIADLDIVLFQVERLTSDVVIARLRVQDFRRLLTLVRDSHISVSILDKHELLFFFADSNCGILGNRLPTVVFADRVFSQLHLVY